MAPSSDPRGCRDAACGDCARSFDDRLGIPAAATKFGAMLLDNPDVPLPSWDILSALLADLHDYAPSIFARLVAARRIVL